jgi:hypothetical protein
MHLYVSGEPRNTLSAADDTHLKHAFHKLLDGTPLSMREESMRLRTRPTALQSAGCSSGWNHALCYPGPLQVRLQHTCQHPT